MCVSLQIGSGLAAIAVEAFLLSEAVGDPAFRGNGVLPFAEFVGRGYLSVDFSSCSAGSSFFRRIAATVGSQAASGATLNGGS